MPLGCRVACPTGSPAGEPKADQGLRSSQDQAREVNPGETKDGKIMAIRFATALLPDPKWPSRLHFWRLVQAGRNRPADGLLMSARTHLYVAACRSCILASYSSDDLMRLINVISLDLRSACFRIGSIICLMRIMDMQLRGVSCCYVRAESPVHVRRIRPPNPSGCQPVARVRPRPGSSPRGFRR
jgi:hypothetical protein